MEKLGIKSTGVLENETRYYITSLTDAKTIGNAIRSHWGIENKLHWRLDVVMQEDQDGKWAGDSAENFAAINKIALNLLTQEPAKISMRRKQKIASYKNEFLEKILKLF